MLPTSLLQADLDLDLGTARLNLTALFSMVLLAEVPIFIMLSLKDSGSLTSTPMQSLKDFVMQSVKQQSFSLFK